MKAKGDPHRPELSGSIRWGAGSVQPRLAGLNYKLNPGEARLNGERVEIPAITLESQGTLTLSGNLDLEGDSRVETRLQGFQAMDRGGNQLWLDGGIRLSGPMAHLVASGQVTVPKALLRPTLFSGGLDPDVVLQEQKRAAKEAALRPGPYRNLQVEVTIAGHNVLLKDPKGQLYLDVALKAAKKPGGELAMGGTIRGVKGSITVENHPFTVERAVVTLPGVPDKPMLVDVRAIHKMSDHEITLVLSITGTTANPRVTPDSSPPMASSDVLSYLVFGGPAASLTQEQYLALAAQGVGGSLTSQKVGEVLGAALPYLSKTGSSGPSPGIRKEITPNVSVSYQRKLNDITGQYESQAVIEYKLNQHLSVDSDISPRNTGADALYNYEW